MLFDAVALKFAFRTFFLSPNGEVQPAHGNRHCDGRGLGCALTGTVVAQYAEATASSSVPARPSVPGSITERPDASCTSSTIRCTDISVEIDGAEPSAAYTVHLRHIADHAPGRDRSVLSARSTRR